MARIVVLSKVIPFSGIPHAGGEHLRRHVAALTSLGHSVIVIAPADRRNTAAAASGKTETAFHLVGTRLTTLTGRVICKASDVLLAARLPRPVVRAFRHDATVLQLLERADIIDVQWTEMMDALKAMQQQSRTVFAKPVLLTAHDVLIQRERRRADLLTRGAPVRRSLFRARLRAARIREPRMLGLADQIIALSEKDAELIRAQHPQAVVSHLDPPLWNASSQRRRPASVQRTGRVIFVAAFNRPENDDAAKWLLTDIWPSVYAKVPTATLRLVGANPRATLVSLAKKTDGVQICGYVDDLAAEYQQAAIAVIPLRAGAGVKFKTVDALLNAVPVVTTTIGSEGIASSDGQPLFSVCNDADEFSKAIVKNLSGAFNARARHAADWARTRYGTARFQQKLAITLASVMTTNPRSK